MKTYVYYVSYVHGTGNSFGFGALELNRSQLIKSFDDIVSIQKQLKIKETDIQNPLIINFILLRVDE